MANTVSCAAIAMAEICVSRHRRTQRKLAFQRWLGHWEKQRRPRLGSSESGSSITRLPLLEVGVPLRP